MKEFIQTNDIHMILFVIHAQFYLKTSSFYGVSLTIKLSSEADRMSEMYYRKLYSICNLNENDDNRVIPINIFVLILS